jgi:2-methylcitrate dehydratase PrpD
MNTHTDRLLDEVANFAIHPGVVPPAVLDEARLVLMDCVGCSLASLRVPSSQALAHWAATRPGEAAVMGLRARTDRETAAFLDGQLINAMDFDPVSSSGHDVPAVVAAALVAVECVSGSGKDLLEAIAVGLEVSARVTRRYRELVRHHGSEQIHHVGHPLYAVSAAAGIARSYGLSFEECRHAIALAAWMRPTDTVADYYAGTSSSMAKYTLFGQLAQIAVTAVELAQVGFSGPSSVFRVDQDFWRIGAKRDADPLPMGEGPWCHLVQHKLMPTNLPTIEVKAAYRDLIARHNLGPGNIERVLVEAGDTGNHIVMRDNALLTEQDCLLHFPYQLACLTLQIPLVSWAIPETRQRTDVREFISRVSVRPSTGPARVEVVTSDGTLEAAAGESPGTMWAPLSAGQVQTLVEKFVECAATLYGLELARGLAQRLLEVDTIRVFDVAQIAPATGLR